MQGIRAGIYFISESILIFAFHSSKTEFTICYISLCNMIYSDNQDNEAK